MQQRIARAFAARTASANPGGDDKAARAAELARRQFPQLVARARSTAPAVGLALDSARRAVHAAGGGAQHLRWDAALFDKLPQAAADLSTRRRPDRAPDPLQRLQGQLNQAIATITRWRAETTTAEASAVAKARDRLLSESEQ